MELNIKLIKIISGEEVVCNLIEEDDHYLVHKGISPIPNANGTVGFVPWCPLEDKDSEGIKLGKQFVMYITEPAEEIAKQFERIINPSALTTPEAKKLIL
tara:strand:+ start:1087 stop:1386 length:300 start_codon:yes stop_codon:yes gene_type:complete